MKIKTDFVTNSSSTSYILEATASYTIDGESFTVSREGYDLTTFDMAKIIEGELQKRRLDRFHLPIIYNQKVYDIIGDGWGGDFRFSGRGDRFFGNENILDEVVTKKDIDLIFQGNQLQIPEEWKYECEQEVIQKRFNLNDDGERLGQND